MSSPERPAGLDPDFGKRLRFRASADDLERFHRDLFLPLVWRVTWRHGLSKEDARDIVQDAFVLALTKLRADGNARSWLTRVVDNLVANARRKTARRSSLSARYGVDLGGCEADPGEADE